MEFCPENFSPDKEYPPNAYIPFSAGSRNCIGQRFAIRESKIILTHLVYNFEFSTDYKLHDNLPIPEAITKPSLGLPLKIKPRKHD